ncbi:MAG: recombinase family protein [Elusimicrobium sp.]|nr:recombinase family protein [Elusimicrobium sp.]
MIDKEMKSQQSVMWNVNVLGAELFIDQLRESTKRGLLKKIDDGEWPTQAPLGYLNVQDGRKKWIKLDTERATLIKRLFEEFSTGTYTVRQMHKRMKDLGLRHRLPGGGPGSPVSKNTIYRILENPFYCGTMVVTRYGETKKVKHNYETLISEALFKRCEDVRLGRKKKSFHYGQRPLIFRGLIKCGCGRAITPYVRKGKYTYLKCTRYREEKFLLTVPWLKK